MSKINLPNKRKELYLSRRKFDDDGNIIEKQCSNCNVFLKVENYFKDKNVFDGLYNNCKECHRNKVKVSDSKNILKIGNSVLKGIDESLLLRRKYKDGWEGI